MQSFHVGYTHATGAAKALFEQGYAFIPFRNIHHDALKRGFKRLFLSRHEGDRANWTIVDEVRPDGLLDPDDGYLTRTGLAGKDEKHIFHYRLTLALRLREQGVKLLPSEDAFLWDCYQEFRMHWEVILEIAHALDRISGFRFLFADKLHATFGTGQMPCLTSRPVLRLVYYPPQQKEQVGAMHIDKSLLTLHVGGEGGNLIARSPDKQEIEISPKEGEAVVFFGAKASMLGQKYDIRLRPLVHGARTSLGAERLGIVSFWHAPIVLWDAPKVPY